MKAYDITAWKDGSISHIEKWETPLEQARDHIRLLVENGIADRAEIKDEAGQLVGQWPRVLRGA